MKVAFTSTDGRIVDQHFGSTREFWVWEVGPDAAEAVGKVSALPSPGADLDEEDRIAARARALAGCAIVYTMQLGGPAAAKLASRKIHPLKTATEIPIAELVARLQAVLKGNPPPWLRKAMTAPAGPGPA